MLWNCFLSAFRLRRMCQGLPAQKRCPGRPGRPSRGVPPAPVQPLRYTKLGFRNIFGNQPSYRTPSCSFLASKTRGTGQRLTRQSTVLVSGMVDSRAHQKIHVDFRWQYILGWPPTGTSVQPEEVWMHSTHFKVPNRHKQHFVKNNSLWLWKQPLCWPTKTQTPELTCVTLNILRIIVSVVLVRTLSIVKT